MITTRLIDHAFAPPGVPVQPESGALIGVDTAFYVFCFTRNSRRIVIVRLQKASAFVSDWSRNGQGSMCQTRRVSISSPAEPRIFR
jgi:hypothetical protein